MIKLSTALKKTLRIDIIVKVKTTITVFNSARTAASGLPLHLAAEQLVQSND